MSGSDPMWPAYAVYGPAAPGKPSAVQQPQPVMLPVTLEPTSEPVWREDEAIEERELIATGGGIPARASDIESQRTAVDVYVRLPDRLNGWMLPRSEFLNDMYDYYLFSVPTTFSAAKDIIPRRLRLQLTLQDANMTGHRALMPTAFYLYPEAEVATEVTNIGRFKIDLGQAVHRLWPTLPDVLTAQTGGSLDVKRIRARVQAIGLGSHQYGWRIADSEIVYNFNPSCIVQVPRGVMLAVNARLHVEVWKRWAVAFHRTYLISARPTRYVLPVAAHAGDWHQSVQVSLEQSYQEIRIETAASASSSSRLRQPEDATPRQSQQEAQTKAEASTHPLPQTAQQEVGESAMVRCSRGHLATSILTEASIDGLGYCPVCMGQKLGRCPTCGIKIHGMKLGLGREAQEYSDDYTLPVSCDGCKNPFPWVTRQQRIYHLETLLDREDVDGITRLLVGYGLMLLRTYGDLDEDEQFELWRRIMSLTPGLVTGSGRNMTETLLSVNLKIRLGLLPVFELDSAPSKPTDLTRPLAL